MDPALRISTERWFVQRGLPHAISGYSATEDVLTRAAPFLSLVFVLEVFAAFDDRFDGWAQFGVLVLAIAIMLGGVAGVNRIRRRAMFQLPDDIGVLELALFVFVPAILPLLFSDERWWRALAIVVFNVGLVAVTYFVTSYGVLPMIRFGAAQMRTRIRQVGHVLARALPLLVLFTTFVFLNAEMWQVASDVPAPFYAIVIGVLLLSTFAFMALRAPREISHLAAFASWNEVRTCVSRTDAPIVDLEPRDPTEAVGAPPLDRTDRFNVAMLVVIAHTVQVVVVAALIGTFYVGFGLLMVRTETIDQWTTSPSTPLGDVELFGATVVLTWEHLAVAGFIAAFSALQFGVAMLTDQAYRDEFYDDVTAEIRGVLAVRALYHDALGEDAAIT